MLHPLIRLIATKPDLLADHIAGYGELMVVQAGEAAAQLRGRAVLAVAALVGIGVGAGLGGMALLLAAALPLDQMPFPWLLLAVPAAPLAAAAGCVLALKRRAAAWSLDPLREQWAADAALLKEAGAA